MSDAQLARLNRGGHDSKKVYAAYAKAMKTNGRPTVILAKTIKGYGLGEGGEGRNVAHNQKKLNEQELLNFRSRFSIPIPEEDVAKTPFYRPSDESIETTYLEKCRKNLGGHLPSRSEDAPALNVPDDKFFEKFTGGSGDREVSTTMGYVSILSALMSNKAIGKHIVPIVPDEARTFGMEGMFRQFGIYAAEGQLYDPVDKDDLMSYREAQDGQILQEGLNEAGSMSSFIAAGVSYSTHGINMIPFYTYYSMFGFQRVGDLIWAAMDIKAKGFLVGAVAGRTTLNGEGLQHEDGHSHLMASTVPGLLSYDPAYVYELALIIKDGLKRMYVDGDVNFYYLTIYNENYEQKAMPEGVEEGVIKGIYKIQSSKNPSQQKVHLLGSGVIINETFKAAQILEEKYQISCDIWSVTSFNRLRDDALECQHWNRLHPEEDEKKSYLETVMADETGLFVSANDYMQIVAEQISPWLPGELVALGTDGYGHSSSREELRRYYEIDAESIVLATLHKLSLQGNLDKSIVAEAMKDLNINPDKQTPFPLY